MRRNTEPFLRIAPHEALLSQAIPLNLGTRPTATVIQRSYDLERLFLRGTLLQAIESETDAGADQALDAFIANQLPSTAFDESSGILSPFWMNLAVCNGHPVSRGWKAFQSQRKQHVLAAVALAERDGWLLRLPFWPLSDQPSREPLVFFSDTGLHRRLIALWEAEQETKAKQIEGTDPDKATALRRSTRHIIGNIADLRFQGFVTHSLMLALPFTRLFVFDRPSQGEIDLILDGPENERWAVEITNGEPSGKPSKVRVFDNICKELGIEKRRRRVVYRVSNARRYHAKEGVIAATLPILLAELIRLLSRPK